MREREFQKLILKKRVSDFRKLREELKLKLKLKFETIS